MTTRLITPPTVMPVDLERAKDNLRIDLDDTTMDTLVEAWIGGITEHAEHYMGRSLITQKWRLTLDGFPDAIRLENPPLVAVTSLQYFDAVGTLQQLSPSDYVVDAASEPGYVVPAYGKAWPETFAQINAVTVEYTAGYGADPASIPQAIKLYILAKLVEQFDPASAVQRDLKADTVQASFLDRLLDRFKVYP